VISQVRLQCCRYSAGQRLSYSVRPLYEGAVAAVCVELDSQWRHLAIDRSTTPVCCHGDSDVPKPRALQTGTGTYTDKQLFNAIGNVKSSAQLPRYKYHIMRKGNTKLNVI